MITYFDRYGNFLGQTDASAPPTPVPAPAPAVPAPSAAARDLAKLDDKVTLTKAGLLVGGIALVALTLTFSGSLLRRS